MPTKTWLCIVAISIVAGCASQGRVQTRAQLSDRFAGAEQISSSGAKDEAMVRIANDAATSGEADTAMRACYSISSSAMKDDTAAKCAEKFERQGRRSVALAFAEMLSSSAEKDRWMRRFAAEAPRGPDHR